MVRTAISGLPMHVSIAHFSFNIDINLIASRYCWSTAAATRKKSKIISSVTRNVGGIIRMVMGSIISVIIGSILYRIIKSSYLSRCVNWKFILLFVSSYAACVRVTVSKMMLSSQFSVWPQKGRHWLVFNNCVSV